MAAQDHIAQENPLAAQAVAQRVWDAAELLLTQPDTGRPGRVMGTREWVVNKTPYLLAYTVEKDVLQILGVIHSKQLWPNMF
ncbi:MAG: type II toxin-antitoxin system RelE/ParE family toxin [Gammaproteobacteria bacterium]|nr:type II toxin-antitoxin system RelE/ParE family toxin [Gammaproteobacteria bacterium]